MSVLGIPVVPGVQLDSKRPPSQVRLLNHFMIHASRYEDLRAVYILCKAGRNMSIEIDHRKASR